MADLQQGEGVRPAWLTRWVNVVGNVYARLQAAILYANGGIVSTANPLPVVEGLVSAAAWQTIINAVRLDDAPTSVNSDNVNVDGYSAMWLLLDIDSTLAPTNIRFIVQVSNDGGTTFWDFEEGLFASLMWEDTETAAGINKAFLVPCGGVDTVRIRAVALGTNAANYFDVTALARPFTGNFGVAHA